MPGSAKFLDLPETYIREITMAKRRKSQLLTTKEAAEILRLRPHTLASACSQGCAA